MISFQDTFEITKDILTVGYIKRLLSSYDDSAVVIFSYDEFDQPVECCVRFKGLETEKQAGARYRKN